MKKLWLAFGLLGVVLQLGYSADPSKRWFRLTILHTNDTHGHLLPFSYPDGVSPDSPVAQMALPHEHRRCGASRDTDSTATRATAALPRAGHRRRRLHGRHAVLAGVSR
jgi:hypothetical protein